jgi:ubiquinol-cytochrome c reductase cytochrome c subunit
MIMHFVRVAAAHVFAVAVAFAACAASPGSAHADGDAQKGKAAFIKNGCWQCHDFAGEGSIATSSGRVIARTALPLDAFKAFVRTTDGPMPPFRPEILSDQDLDDIYAYLQSLPAPKQASDIPLLNDARSQ